MERLKGMTLSYSGDAEDRGILQKIVDDK